MTPNWYQQAACRGHDPNLFVPPYTGRNLKTARQICQTCPVQTNCLQHAIQTQTTEQLLGIYAGTTENQRSKIINPTPTKPQPRRTTRTPTHGTLYSYRQAKCRCQPCKAAHARTIARQRRTRRNTSGTYPQTETT